MAKTTLWTGGSSSNWHFTSNWSQGIPSAGDSAIIVMSGSMVTIENDVQVDYIFIGANTTLVVNSNLSLNNSAGDAIQAEGLLVVTGSISIVNPQGEGLLVSDSLHNSGTIYIQDVHTFPNFGLRIDKGKLINMNTIILNNCRIGFVCSESFVHNSTSGSIITIGCGITFRQSSIFSLNEGSLNTSAGNLNVIEDGKLTHSANADAQIEGGTLIVNKNSILDSYGNINAQGGYGSSMDMKGKLYLKNNSTTTLDLNMNYKMRAFEGGQITVEQGAILTLD